MTNDEKKLTNIRIDDGLAVIPTGAKYQGDVLFVETNETKLKELEKELSNAK